MLKINKEPEHKNQEELYKRLTELEETQRATLNILEDFDQEKSKLKEFQQATFNILEDMYEERSKLDGKWSEVNRMKPSGCS